MQFAGRVHFLQEHFSEIIGTFQAEDHHAQMTRSRDLEARI